MTFIGYAFTKKYYKLFDFVAHKEYYIRRNLSILLLVTKDVYELCAWSGENEQAKTTTLIHIGDVRFVLKTRFDLLDLRAGLLCCEVMKSRKGEVAVKIKSKFIAVKILDWEEQIINLG